MTMNEWVNDRQTLAQVTQRRSRPHTALGGAPRRHRATRSRANAVAWGVAGPSGATSSHLIREGSIELAKLCGP